MKPRPRLEPLDLDRVRRDMLIARISTLGHDRCLLHCALAETTSEPLLWSEKREWRKVVSRDRS
jgi:hypothetical protein